METHLLKFVERARCLSGDELISSEFSLSFFARKRNHKKVAGRHLVLVRQRSASMKEDYDLTTLAGGMKENVKKNRYKDILPYDQTRVCLTPTSSEYKSDYINASYIKGASTNRTYIATQGPLSSTVVDFWRMIWQHNVKVIIMACREIELGKKKCEVYWSPTTETSIFGPFAVSTLEESHPNEEVIVRTLVVKYCDETRKVSHFQYTAWPDHGIPKLPDGILGMMELARKKQGKQTDPIVIHCSAGCGRTGVICAIDHVNDLLLTETIKGDFNILDLVLELRRQRPSAVQTKEQYGFVLSTVAQMFQKALQNDITAPDSIYINTVSPEKKPAKSGSLSSIGEPQKSRASPLRSRFSHPLPQTSMNDTYAIVNKPKLQLPTAHHYENAHLDKANNNALYSTVKPKNRPVSPLPPTATPVHDRAIANQRGGAGPKVTDSEGYEILPAGSQSLTDDDYEYVSSSRNPSTLFAPGSLGFNSRVKKPKGPRDPPVEWSRAER